MTPDQRQYRHMDLVAELGAKIRRGPRALGSDADVWRGRHLAREALYVTTAEEAEERLRAAAVLLQAALPEEAEEAEALADAYTDVG